MKPQSVSFMYSSQLCLSLTWDVKDRHSLTFAYWISVSEIKIKPQKTYPILVFVTMPRVSALFTSWLTKMKTWSLNMWPLSVITICHHVYCQLWCSMTKFRNADIILVGPRVKTLLWVLWIYGPYNNCLRWKHCEGMGCFHLVQNGASVGYLTLHLNFRFHKGMDFLAHLTRY
jgi:hypothetical protein